VKKQNITLMVNGEERHLSVYPNELLLNVIRQDLNLIGAKYGCGIGECGSCTVLVNGAPTVSCLTLAVAVDGCEILTVEGVAAPDGTLHRVQQAFIDHAAVQCGFCTPGMVLMGVALLKENPAPSEEAIREHYKGNLCRCTGYTSIVRAIQSASGMEVAPLEPAVDVLSGPA
jgi:aerobic-type carbon monoxide dehydrogenase small subunit (CoxS/CutS family)